MNPTATPTETNPLPTGGKKRALGRLLRQGFLPNMIKDRLPPEAAVEAAVAAGIEAVEISCRRPDTIELLKRLRKSFTGVSFGVSSLIEDGPYFDFLQARGPRFPSIAEAADAGADFLVSALPFSEATYTRYRDSHVIVAGVGSAAEGNRALDLGANLLKFVNPHLLGGPEFFRAMDLATFRTFPYFVTGALKSYHVGGYVSIGALAVGVNFDQILGPANVHQRHCAGARRLRRAPQRTLPADHFPRPLCGQFRRLPDYAAGPEP